MVDALLPSIRFEGEERFLPGFRDRRQLEEVARDNNLRIAWLATVPQRDVCKYLNPTERLIRLLAKLHSELRERIKELAVDHRNWSGVSQQPQM